MKSAKHATAVEKSTDRFIFIFFFRDDVQQLFREKDRDFDGYLSFEEFTGQETKIEMAFKVCND